MTTPDPPRPTGWPALRNRLLHGYFLVARPMTLGVRAIVCDSNAGQVFLIRHTYVPGWHLPGGGVERGETTLQALKRELAEEGNIELDETPRLVSLHFNRQSSPRDHVALYMAGSFRQTAPRLPDREIAESGFFPMGELPPDTTGATRRRLAEAFAGAAPSPYW